MHHEMMSGKSLLGYRILILYLDLNPSPSTISMVLGHVACNLSVVVDL